MLSEVSVTSGVPQGSVLGPLLFLLYVNALPQNVQSQVRLFADDTAVYLTVTSPEDVNTLQADLNILQEWERTWDMEFNPGKCQVLHITRCKQPLQSQYTLLGQVLESTDSAKYLGINISKDLNWNHHIDEITSKANRTRGGAGGQNQVHLQNVGCLRQSLSEVHSLTTTYKKAFIL